MKPRVFFMPIVSTLLLAGCQSAPSVNAKMALPPELAEAYKGNIKAFHSAYIRPHYKTGTYEIPFDDGEKLRLAAIDVIEGFKTFCKKSGGNAQRTGNHWSGQSCYKEEEYLGAFTVTSDGSSMLRVRYDTPDAKREREHVKAEYEISLEFNGPTGTLITADDSFNFQRIGYLSKRVVFALWDGDGKSEVILFDDIAHMVKTESGIELAMHDGSRKEFKKYTLALYSGSVSFLSHENLPVVVKDPLTLQPYVISTSLQELKEIRFAPKETWENRQLVQIDSDLEKIINANQPSYLFTIQLMADHQNTLAKENGWYAQLDAGRINGPLYDGVIRKLKNHVGYDRCSELNLNKRNGATIDRVLECRQATEELRLLRKGYAISVKHTPLAIMALVEQLKVDLN
ncbi:TPA: hypothetical protein NU929_000460 [Vibrio cholerae]|nr:hypothetical protein [Vibrio cholerae]